MSLTVSQGNIGGSSMGDGIFIDKAVIAAITDLSKEESKYDNDLHIEVTFKLLKNDWERNLNISGRFNKDASGEIENWGGAFKVRDFFINIGLTKLLESNLPYIESGFVPEELLEAVIEKECYLLSYRNIKGKTSTWNQIASLATDKDNFKRYFISQANKGYPRNYSPTGSSITEVEPSDIKGSQVEHL